MTGVHSGQGAVIPTEQSAGVIPTMAVKAIRAFIDAQNITCAETIYQTDRVIENAYEFLERLCDIVGYKESDDE